MSDLITTLKKKDDISVNVYPNIKGDNIPNSSITNPKLASGCVDFSNLSNNLHKFILQLQYTYKIYIGNGSDDLPYYLYGTTTLSNSINSFTDTEISHALDFDKAEADYTSTDLQILQIIIDGIATSEGWTHNYNEFVGASNDYKFGIYIDDSKYYIVMIDSTDTKQFELVFDTTYQIVSLINNKYVYLDLYRLINTNVNME